MNEKTPQFLLIDKPVGWTSFDVVAYIRKSAQGGSAVRPKVGHAGTLDPFATGLLIVGVGREATKKLDEFKKLPKTYIATIELGATSDTYDVTGKITSTVIPTPSTPLGINSAEGSLKVGERDSSIPLRCSRNDIESFLKNFTGKQMQIPPMYSAKKIDGQRLYELARQGRTVERQPTKIEIYNIKILEYSWPILKIEIQCSTGTYIRSLAHDLGQKLGTGAYCRELVRTAIGPFELKNAQKLA